MNIMRTGILLAAMTGLFLAVGFLLGGQTGMILAFVVALGMNAFSYWNADKMVLRMHGAEEANEATQPEFYQLIAELSERAGMPMPKVYIMHQDQPNAFATGRNPENAAVAATTGLLRALSREEIAGVMAHELAHIKNRDTLIMTITATIAGAISMLANFALFFGRGRDNPLGFVGTIAMMFLAPFAAMLVQMAISRTREYAADRGGAEICGNPAWLASALGKIANGARRIENHQAEANPATAHMFIINPLSGKRMDGLFSTHPDTQNRIDALMSMQGVAGNAMTDGPGESKHAPGPWDQQSQQKRGPWG